MIKNFIVYSNATGEILRTGSCVDTDLFLQSQTGETVIEGDAKDDLNYIDLITEDILTKTVMSLVFTPAGTGWDITGIPNPTMVEITTQSTFTEVEITDGLLEYRTDVLGFHIFRFTSKEFKIETIKETKV